MASLFGIFTNTHRNTRTDFYFEDHKKNEDYDIKVFELERKKSRMIQVIDRTEELVKTKALVDSDGLFKLGYELNIRHPRMTRDLFMNYLTKYDSVLPSDLIPYDPLYIKSYMSESSIEMQTYFDSKALEKLFAIGTTEQKLCYHYVETLELGAKEKCHESKFSRFFKGLWNKYQKAKFHFEAVLNTDLDYVRFRNLKVLAKFIFDKKFKYNILKYLIAISEDENYYRNVSIKSLLTPFLGDVDEATLFHNFAS